MAGGPAVVTRQPDFATSARSRHAAGWGTIALAAGVLALALTAFGAWRAREEARAAQGRLAEVRREVDVAAARLRALDASSRLEGMQLLSAAEAPPARIVADVASALPSDVRLDRLVVDYTRGGDVEMLVVARDALAWDRLLERMERSPAFREIVPGPEAREAEVRSLVRARWVGGAR